MGSELDQSGVAVGYETEAVGPEYQSLAVPAVASLLLGLLSPAALATPLLLVAPAAAVGMAALALSRIRNSGGTLTGAGLARAGLALGLLFGAAAVARPPVRTALLEQQMDRFVGEWCELVARGEFDRAEFMLSGQAQGLLMPRVEPGQPPPPDEEAKAARRENFRKDSTVRRLSELDAPIEVELTSHVDGPVVDSRQVNMTRSYLVTGAGKAEPLPIEFRCLRYRPNGKGANRWRIDRWEMKRGA